jgi:DNA-binding SARP family transcriptional activator
VGTLPEAGQRAFEGDSTLAQKLLRDYCQARTAFEQFSRDFRAYEALLTNLANVVPDRKPASAPTNTSDGPRRPVVSLYCLGRFCIEVNGRALDTSGVGRSLTILKLLAGRGRRSTPRDVLLEALWPDSEAEVAGNRLRVAMHGLRRLLASADPGELLVFRDGCYLLNPGGLVRVDADDFEVLWEQGVRLEREGRRADATDAFVHAEALYAGDYLEEDLYEEWTLLRRERLRDAYLHLLAMLAEWAAADGDYAGCIVHCQKILAQDACREDIYRLLMRAHAAAGQRSRALRWYEICAVTLRRELDMAPSDETAALARRLRDGFLD